MRDISNGSIKRSNIVADISRMQSNFSRMLIQMRISVCFGELLDRKRSAIARTNGVDGGGLVFLGLI